MSSKAHIFFNRPYVAGKEADNVQHVLASRKFSGDGVFTRICEQFFEQKFAFGKTMLTPSCTHGLEMAALLVDIQPGDEVIVPSFTFVSTANAFALRGAKIVFADSCSEHPNIDPAQIASLITEKTKAVVVVHYAGMACDMDAILRITKAKGITLIEDAAHAIQSSYKGKALGSIGDISVMSFHETKNITCGEGGLIAVNNPVFVERAEVVRNKGTNRKAFYRGETDRYSWVGLGSSFFPSEFGAAVLSAQLDALDRISYQRVILWHRYQSNLKKLADDGKIIPSSVPDGAATNGHLYYILCKSADERALLMKHLSADGIDSVFHYLSLHASPYFSDKHDGRELPNSDRFTNCLLRLPMYYDLQIADVDRVCESISKFYK